ncbi:Hypothetical protein SMAX5B_013902 [Scophthalmus maximus]|uniref:Uncharacterized protein n=1 Tax=Scophthalmus maximus TaxID=52904 RepID=A0A2U9CFV4_SCOMX|nr:Hypothetical protein SMAX5B_013902 [Scophthalmus maximus]
MLQRTNTDAELRSAELTLFFEDSGFISLRRSSAPRRSAPATIIPLGCGKLVNPRPAIGHGEARDSDVA